ncbi:MAG: hypothetical protein C0417_12865 [Chlorobiaceae bacterium]|nr:hypothetical protein [Chlorobiaceae bacterium]
MKNHEDFVKCNHKHYQYNPQFNGEDMNRLKIFATLVILNCIMLVELIGQVTDPARIAILPLHANGIDSVYIMTAESILRTEIGKLSTMDIVSLKRTRDALEGTVCIENECALEIGKKLDASQVLGCQLSALGEKIIVQYFLVDVPTNRQILIDQVTASNVEDLEMLMKRIAKSVVGGERIGKDVEVGNILASESQESLRRTSKKNFGLSFGYLYPQHGYDNSDRSFVMDGRFDYELEDWAVGMLIGIRKGFAMNLYGSYLFSRKDLCPYLGGAFGFHWVSHPDPYIAYPRNQNELRSDGFELIGNAGIRVLHTYNFQLIFHLEYIVTLNDYNDQAIVFTIGIL